MKVSLGRNTVKIAGFGGQGVVLASIILGRAALLDGKYSTQTASYGSAPLLCSVNLSLQNR